MQEWLAGAQRLVEADLAEVEQALLEISSSGDPLLDEVCRHVLEAGGKKIRPTLLLLSARATRPGTGSLGPDTTGVAAGVELVHVASLLHDDVIDGSPLRRGRETANSHWGNKVSIFAADFLFASIYAHLATPENTPILRLIACAVVEMCKAEALQATATGDPDLTEECYLRIIDGKTAALMSAACEAGAALAGADEEQRSALRAFGRSLGLVFQITDDLLDLTGDPTETGKARGTDLRSGYFTLPLLTLRDRLPASERAELAAQLGRCEQLSDEDAERIARRAHETGSLERTRQVTQTHVADALAALGALAPSTERDALEGLTRGLVLRRS